MKEVAQGVGKDMDGQLPLSLLPFIIGLILLLVGIVMVVGGSHGPGLSVAGFGFLLLGVGGGGSISYAGLKVTGPVGLILVIAGVIIAYLGW